MLLLVHGFPRSDHTLWRNQIDYFSNHYRVIAPDLRGFADSCHAALADGSAATTMRHFADDLALLLDELRVTEPIVYCGLSMGGYIGWQFCDRYAARLAGLVACDTRTVADTAQAAEGREALAVRTLAEGTSVVAAAMMRKLFNAAMQAAHPECVEETNAMIARATPQGVAGALRGMAVRPEISAAVLGQIAVPTLVIVGEQDRSRRWPRCAKSPHRFLRPIFKCCPMLGT